MQGSSSFPWPAGENGTARASFALAKHPVRSCWKLQLAGQLFLNPSAMRSLVLRARAAGAASQSLHHQRVPWAVLREQATVTVHSVPTEAVGTCGKPAGPASPFAPLARPLLQQSGQLK